MVHQGSETQRPGPEIILRSQVSALRFLRTVSLDGRSGARVREPDFNLTPVPVSTRTSKGLTITKWTLKEVSPYDLELK